MKLKVYAKLNLVLKALEKVDRLHVLDMINSSISLYDELEVNKSDKLSVLCEGADIPESENIAYKAAMAFSKRFLCGAVEVKIKKGIPMMGGLGGSSADGAGVVLAMSKLYGVTLTAADMEFFAQNVSSDLPYMIEGGLARVSGFGGEIKKLQSEISFCGVAVKSKHTASTGAVYSLFDELKIDDESVDVKSVLKGLENGDGAVFELFFNDLTCAARKLLSDLEEIEGDLRSLNPEKTLLCGSGGCVAALFKEKLPDISRLKEKYASVFTFESVKNGIEIVE